MTTFLLETVCSAGHKRRVRLLSPSREAALQLATILMDTNGNGPPLACKVCGRPLGPFTVEEIPAVALTNGAAGGK